VRRSIYNYLSDNTQYKSTKRKL